MEKITPVQDEVLRAMRNWGPIIITHTRCVLEVGTGPDVRTRLISPRTIASLIHAGMIAQEGQEYNLTPAAYALWKPATPLYQYD
jgi:hypothetical protein